MQRRMRFVEDTQVDWRFFPKGAEVQSIHAGSHALVLPDTQAHTTICAIPLGSLVALKPFRMLLANRIVG